MNQNLLIVVAALCAGSRASGAFAQTRPMPGNMPQGADKIMPGSLPKPLFTPPPAAKRPVIPDFPTPQELARITPPEPMTEAKIKQRFAEQREVLQTAIERDRKRAEKYARDFDRYQKYQAQQLARIMADAERQRESMLKHIDQREQRVLENFRQHQKDDTQKPEQ